MPSPRKKPPPKTATKPVTKLPRRRVSSRQAWLAPLIGPRARRWWVAGALVVAVGVAGWWWQRQHVPSRRMYRSFGIALPTAYRVHGIDVSHYQGAIDWTRVRAMRAGNVRLRFAFVKATEGTQLADENFADNWRGAGAAGLLRGAYHFYRPGQDAAAQAAFFLRQANPQPGDLPPVLDLELTDRQPDSVVYRGARVWLRAVEAHCGTRPIIYTGRNFYYLHVQREFPGYPLWIAHYDQDALLLPPNRRWHFWQHADNGTVNGIGERVDFNVFCCDSTALASLRLRPRPVAQKRHR